MEIALDDEFGLRGPGKITFPGVSPRVSQGLIWLAKMSFYRGLSTVVAAWLEEQGGFPLFTLEGEEPDVAKLSWDLPSMVARGAADASRQLGGEGPGQEVHAEIPSPASRHVCGHVFRSKGEGGRGVNDAEDQAATQTNYGNGSWGVHQD